MFLSASFKDRFLFSYCWSEWNDTLVAWKGNVLPLISYSQPESVQAWRKGSQYASKGQVSREVGGHGNSAGLDWGNPCSNLLYVMGDLERMISFLWLTMAYNYRVQCHSYVEHILFQIVTPPFISPLLWYFLKTLYIIP